MSVLFQMLKIIKSQNFMHQRALEWILNCVWKLEILRSFYIIAPFFDRQ